MILFLNSYIALLSKLAFFSKTLIAFICIIAMSSPLFSNQVTWIAESPENDMENPTNWSSNTIPCITDDAVFDSSISNVANNPTEQTTDFLVNTFHFANSASPFTIAINNQTLQFNGLGITGAHTDATINVVNTNNLSIIETQVSFVGCGCESSSSGNVIFNIANIATLIGNVSDSALSNTVRQFLALTSFSMKRDGILNVINSGENASTGTGNNQIAILSSGQAWFYDSFSVEDNVSISLSNEGNYIGSNSEGGNAVGFIQDVQFLAGGDFQAGDNLSFRVGNSGINSSTGGFNNFIGIVMGAQADFEGNCIIGKHGNIAISNQGTNSAQETPNSFTGYVVDQQLYVRNRFQAGDHLSMIISNEGRDDSLGLGGGITSTIDSLSGLTGSQVVFNSLCNVGKNAYITTQNIGACSGTKTWQGAIVNAINQNQMLFSGKFNTGDALNMSILNSGEDSSASVGSNFIGTVSSSQLGFDSSCTLGKDATITVGNSGNFSGNNSTTFGYAGFIGNKQVLANDDFRAGDFFHLQVENAGMYSGSGVGSDFVGAALGGQVGFLGETCALGNNATILVSNRGTNNGTSTLNHVGYCGASQFQVAGDFVAGKNLNISIFNSAMSTGDINNNIGYVNGSQALFQEAVTIDEGSQISAFNRGTVTGSQIFLNQGFNTLNGKATIQAVNHGSVGGNGITVRGSSLGGNANIILENTSFDVDTEFSTFTIGELNGDSTSTVLSHPTLIINTDASTNANFAGAIQDFPSRVSELIKKGIGTQKLSGANSYTGLTAIQEGSLVLTGSLAGDVNVHSLGVLKGTGIIGGKLENSGTISPGESIGTLTILGDLINNNGNFDLEVKGLDHDQINVSGTSVLNGGNVVVNTIGGPYQFHSPFTILNAANISGAFTGATSLSPMLMSSLSYDANQVYLTLQTAIFNAARTSNQLAVAERLDGIVNPNISQVILLSKIVDLSVTDAQEALVDLSGPQHTGDLWITEILNRQFIRRLYDPLRSIVTKEPKVCCNSCGTWTTFLEGSGGYSSIHGNKNARGFHMNSYQLITGIQKSFSGALTAGIAGSYEYDRQHYHKRGSGSCKTGLLGLYGLYRPNCYYGLVDVGYGYSWRKINRSIRIDQLNYTAHSHPKISQFLFYSEVGNDLKINCFLIQPFVGIEMGNSWRHHVKESERHGWGLTINAKSKFITSSRLGLHLSTNSMFDSFDVSVDVAWNHLLSNSKNRIRGRFIEFGDSFNIEGIKLNKNSIDYALTISNSWWDCLNSYLEVIGESWKHSTTINVLAGIEYTW